ncbi:MAG TPA: thioredoxin family protein [Acidobacteriaceae bacterium]|jgi:peroxiredoxin|nr:thioredoxin family protein [Acidobacteriaceae bacterium]
MALTKSTMLPLGSAAPDFALPEVISNNIIRLDDFRGTTKALVVMFICAHCPYVKHVEQGLATFGRDYQDSAAGIVAISSNDIKINRDDSPEHLRKQAENCGFTFDYLYDETQDAAKAYQAACTPDIFLFDDEMRLVYRGQFDASRPGSGVPVTGQDLRAALDAVLAGKPVSPNQHASIGCNIKWKI